MAKAERFHEAQKLFKQHGGTLRMAQALNLGLTRKTLYAMRDAGVVECVTRGVYRLSNLPPLGNPDLVTVATRIPNGVICLISALDYHDLTTEIPHKVYVAIERGSEMPRLDYPPTRFFWFSGAAFASGIETHKLDGVPVRIYSAEKTIADCFKYRNKVGMDVAIEALRSWSKRRGRSVDALLKQARVCRVEKVIRPILEAML